MVTGNNQVLQGKNTVRKRYDDPASVAYHLWWRHGDILENRNYQLGIQGFYFSRYNWNDASFTSMRSGISIIWDREFGFLKEILVAPISRTSIVIGKAMGGATNALIQGAMLLMLSFIVGVHISPVDFISIIPIMLLISIGFDCFGLFIASIMDSFEGFQTIMSFVIMPTFFLSGALFPLTNAPAWLKTLSSLNPLTYGVDAIREIILNEGRFSMFHDLLVLFGFSILMLIITSWMFNQKK